MPVARYGRSLRDHLQSSARMCSLLCIRPCHARQTCPCVGTFHIYLNGFGRVITKLTGINGPSGNDVRDDSAHDHPACGLLHLGPLLFCLLTAISKKKRRIQMLLRGKGLFRHLVCSLLPIRTRGDVVRNETLYRRVALSETLLGLTTTRQQRGCVCAGTQQWPVPGCCPRSARDARREPHRIHSICSHWFIVVLFLFFHRAAASNRQPHNGAGSHQKKVLARDRTIGSTLPGWAS